MKTNNQNTITWPTSWLMSLFLWDFSRIFFFVFVTLEKWDKKKTNNIYHELRETVWKITTTTTEVATHVVVRQLSSSSIRFTLTTHLFQALKELNSGRQKRSFLKQKRDITPLRNLWYMIHKKSKQNPTAANINSRWSKQTRGTRDEQVSKENNVTPESGKTEGMEGREAQIHKAGPLQIAHTMPATNLALKLQAMLVRAFYLFWFPLLLVLFLLFLAKHEEKERKERDRDREIVCKEKIEMHTLASWKPPASDAASKSVCKPKAFAKVLPWLNHQLVHAGQPGNAPCNVVVD